MSSAQHSPNTNGTTNEKNAWQFVMLLGLVSLFSDMVYEGARSIIGPYLALLGASGAAVGIIAGLGELVSYALRFISGYIVERTSRYWLFTFLGYLSNLSVPLLAWAGSWQVAALLIMLERLGKAARTPARDAMISYASKNIGMGKGFGVHQSLDQIGAMMGPLIAAGVLYIHGGYQLSFGLFILPALITLVILWIAQRRYPQPKELEVHCPDLSPQKMNRLFWIYLIGCSLVAAGYADFPLMAYHFQKTSLFSTPWIPLTYVIAMGAGAATALFLGRMYDKKGGEILLWVIPIASLFAPLVFLSKNPLIVISGMVLWGIGMGAQKSLIKAVVGTLVSREKRASAYGIFNTVFGIAWFIGSAAMGLLYDISLLDLAIFSLLAQLSALPFMFIVQKQLHVH